METSLERSRHTRVLRNGRFPRSLSRVFAWVLIAGFLLQPVLTYLVTPVVSHDLGGQQVVVCTLNGSKVVTIDLASDVAPAFDNHDHCPALKLFQMAGAVQLAQPVVPPSRVLFAARAIDHTSDRLHRSVRFSAYATRAPPIA